MATFIVGTRVRVSPAWRETSPERRASPLPSARDGECTIGIPGPAMKPGEVPVIYQRLTWYVDAGYVEAINDNVLD